MSVEKRKVTRDTILRGAREILDGGTTKALTVDALARSLRMSKSTLYKHFISKTAVIEQLIDGICGETESQLEAVMSSGAPEAQLDGVVEVLASLADALPKAAILQPEKLPKKSRQRLQATRDAISSAVMDVVRRGAESGAFGFDQPMLAGTAYAAVAFAAMEDASRRDVARGDVVRHLNALLLPGLRAA